MAGKKVKFIFCSFLDYWKSGKYIFLYNIFERLTFFAFYISIARYIDKDIYGFIVAVFSLTNILATIFDLGIPFYIQRESAAGTKAKLFLFQSIYLKLFSLLIFLPIPFLYFSQDINRWLIIFLVSIIIFLALLNQILVAYLNGLNKFRENYLGILYSRLPYFLFLIIAIVFKIDVHFSLVSIFLTLLVQSFFLLRSTDIKLLDFADNRIDFNEIKQLIRASYPFGLGLIFVMMYDRVDVLIIQKLLNNESVAIYSAAYSLYRNTSIFSGIIILKVYNDFSKQFRKSGQIDLSSIKTSFAILILMSLALIMIFVLGGDILIILFFSSRFIQSVEVLKLVSFAIPFLFLNNLTGVLLNSIHQEKLTMFTTLGGLIVNVILNFLLIPVYKLNGAVFATIGTETFVFVSQLLFILFVIKIKKDLNKK